MIAKPEIRSIATRLLREMLLRKDAEITFDETSELRQLGFRSLDFAEFAVRLENEIKTPINFDASPVRQVQTVNDLLSFFETRVS